MKRTLAICTLVGFLAALDVGNVRAAEPAAVWQFDGEEQTPLAAKGGVRRDAPGPRPPTYPLFEANNTAAEFDGRGARFEFADPGPESPFDFTNGDEITLEAWVKPTKLSDGENRYVIGKGRTGDGRFARNNQNWALRLRGVEGSARPSFLFATPTAAGVSQKDAHWHRWTASAGFPVSVGGGWHHVAITYRFGEPGSIRGWVDGQPVQGGWDMGGPTAEAPVVDDDAVWIGSALNGSASNSFEGSIDSVGVHRGALDEEALRSRFAREGGSSEGGPAPETMPTVDLASADRVLVTLHEGAPSHDRWLMSDEAWPTESLRWETNAFLLPRLPLRYDPWGIREAWKPPVLVRMAADVALPPGEHRLLLRARGLSRLWVDGHLVARTGPIPGSPNGEEPMTPLADPPLPGLRRAEHRVQEVFADVEVGSGGSVRVILEAMAGGKKFRVETGELLIAVQTPDGKSYEVLKPAGFGGEGLPLTDGAVESALGEIEALLAKFDNRRRRELATSRDAFWQRRHEAARTWALQNPAPEVPATFTSGSHSTDNPPSTAHPIDAFLADKIARAKAAAAAVPAGEAERFQAEVLPILSGECFRCHADKGQGGLRLDSLEAAVRGGDSQVPALVPGDAAASEMIARLRSDSEFERMPPAGEGLSTQQIAALERWIDGGAAWPEPPLLAEQTELAPPIDDAAFLRRVYLDTVGVPPGEIEVRAFLADALPNKRAGVARELLNDPRWADHWMGYWQDVLAENPTLINATLNSTGPFRWFLYDSLRDDKPLDRMVTELILLRGGSHEGGSAGFALAAQNDSPLAAKGHILAAAFLGVEMQCARCHDSPYHSTKQRDLYSLAAMLNRKPLAAPASSSVPAAFFEAKERESLIQVTLKPGEPVPPAWPFAALTGAADGPAIDALLEDPQDPRERLAALITAPQNRRFAQVIVNRIWKRLMGAGIVEPVEDWEGHAPSHPELLDWLANEFVASGYSVKHVAGLILTSQAYARRAVGQNLRAEPARRFFNGPEQRRMSAEQVVDSLYAAAGVAMDIEPLTLDPDGRREAGNRLSLGRASRAWMLVSLSNERDRPSLTLPYAASVVEVLETFGWTAARQTPRSVRDADPNVLQPGVLANGPLTLALTRASRGSPLAEMAIAAECPEKLAESLFLRLLGRPPSGPEREAFAAALGEGFDARLIPADQVRREPDPEPLPQVTWSNHLRAEANTIQQEHARRVAAGPPPDERLEPMWREAYEDAVWSLINSPEWVWVP